MTTPEFLFLPTVLPTLSRSMQAICLVIVLCPYVFLYLAAAVDPGYVVSDTLDLHGSLYPYDHILYLPGNFCKTCRQPKPPRSKHCGICGHCVAKMDHHCIFINGCVGYGNQHWFLLLLLTTAILTTSGAILGGNYLLQLIRTVAPPFHLWRSGLSWLDYFRVWSLGLEMDPGVGCVALLCLLITPLVWGLFLYSTYLVYRGMTTNESGKWGDFQLDIVDGSIYRRPLSHIRQRDLRMEPNVLDWPKSASHAYTRWYEVSPVNAFDRPGEDIWEKVTTLEVVENIYDIGFLKNLTDVFLPRSYL
jgi:palmitoyltransferase ZDHHC4